MKIEENELYLDDKKYIRVACRICGEIMCFPKSFYKESDFTNGWFCNGSLSKLCNEVRTIYGSKC